MTAFGDVRSDTRLRRQLIVPISDFRMGVSSPTEVVLGSSPGIPALLFDNPPELASTFAQMPTNWDRSVDVDLVLAIQLVNGQLDGDALDMTVDYVVPRQNDTGNGVTKTSTQLLPSLVVSTASGLAAGDAYELRATFNRNDASNPFTSVNALGFGFELHLTNLIEVGAFHLLSTCFSYEALR